jgi:hypothetical protein
MLDLNASDPLTICDRNMVNPTLHRIMTASFLDTSGGAMQEPCQPDEVQYYLRFTDT